MPLTLGYAHLVPGTEESGFSIILVAKSLMTESSW